MFNLQQNSNRVKKFDAIIANYLYRHKSMELEQIGSFTLDSSFVLPPEAEKSAFFPLEGIKFTYNRQAQNSPELMDYIVEQTGKIRSLISADFDSYLTEIRSFVNLGKPWVIAGIGTLQKIKDGSYELVPGQLSSERINTQYYVPEEENNEDEKVRKRKWFVTFLLAIAGLIVLGGLGFGIYTLFIKTSTPSAEVSTIEPDTSVSVFDSANATRPDTATIRQDSLPATDTVRYRAIFTVTKWRQKASTTLNYWNRTGVPAFMDSLIMADTLRYRVFIYKRALPADTNKVKESLAKVFGTRIILEPKQ